MSVPSAPGRTGYTDEDLQQRHVAFCAYAAGYRNHGHQTIHWYQDTYKQFGAYLSARGVTWLDASHAVAYLESWVMMLRDRKLSPFTIRSYLDALRAFFSYLEEHDGFPSPFRSLRLPTVPDPLPKACSAEECIRILDACANTEWNNPFERARGTAMIAMAIYAGLRRGEILRLKFTDVDLEGGWIHVIRGKGIGGGKDRTTCAGPELRAILAAYLHERRLRNLRSVEFFTAQRGGHGVSTVTLGRIVERVRATAGVPFSLHRLRHSFITLLVQARTPIHVVRELAGHRDLKTTQRYLRVFDEEKLRYVSRLALLGNRHDVRLRSV
jgi:site-specific recombinase XerD